MRRLAESRKLTPGYPDRFSHTDHVCLKTCTVETTFNRPIFLGVIIYVHPTPFQLILILSPTTNSDSALLRQIFIYLFSIDI